MDWENAGRGDAVDVYETDVLNQIINPIEDFEVTRFGHSFWDVAQTNTSANYEFYFFDDQVGVTATTNANNWSLDYEGAGFTDNELYFFAPSFARSFFKLDFYDTKQTETQRIFFSIIIPTQQGLKRPGFIGPSANQTAVEVKIPKFVLDYVGDKEGFFVYWLKNTTFLDIDNFYMSCKFFDAKSGQFLRMLNDSQGTLPNKFNFPSSEKFYYKCVLDYSTYEYAIYKESSNNTLTRVGTTTNPIKWYEYVNP